MKTITTKYHGPTNFAGSRVSATDGENRIILSLCLICDCPTSESRLFCSAACAEIYEQFDHELEALGRMAGEIENFSRYMAR